MPKQRHINDCTQVFAVPGTDHAIDMVHPDTGRSWCYGKTLADVQAEEPAAVIMCWEEFRQSKAARQDAEPREWAEVTAERYDEMLNVLPPAAWHNGAFLVGEAMDHHAGTGRPRFTCFKREGGKHYRCCAPITHAEFKQLFGNCSYDYIE